MSEPRIAGCSGIERCAPIPRATTGLSPRRPIATLTVNTASACASRTLRYDAPRKLGIFPLSLLGCEEWLLHRNRSRHSRYQTLWAQS
jgi:hypothetical protein